MMWPGDESRTATVKGLKDYNLNGLNNITYTIDRKNR